MVAIGLIIRINQNIKVGLYIGKRKIKKRFAISSIECFMFKRAFSCCNQPGKLSKPSCMPLPVTQSKALEQT